MLQIKRGSSIFKIMLLLYILAVLWLCFMRTDDMPQIVRVSFWGIPIDKAVHFLMFLPFVFCVYLAFDVKTKKTLWRMANIIIIFIIGTMVAMGTELGQGMLGYRSADQMDFFTDCLALASASFILVVYESIQSISGR